MNLYKSTAWWLLKNATLALPIILFAAILLNVLWLQNSETYKGFNYTKQYIFTSCLPALLFGYLIGVGFAKLKGHHLWFTNAQYRTTLLRTSIALVVLFSLISALMLIIASKLSPLYLLIPICLSLLAFFSNFSNSIKINIFNSLLCSALLITLMIESTSKIAQFVVVGVTILKAVLVYQCPKSQEINRSKLRLTDSESITHWNVRIAAVSAKLKRNFGKDIIWAISFPQTRLGLMALYFSAIITLFLTVNTNQLIISFILLTLLVSCQLPVYQEFTQLKHQLKSIAHSYQSAPLLIKDLVQGFDKIVITNTFIVMSISLFTCLIQQRFELSIALFTMTILASAIFLAISPVLIIYYDKSISFKNLIIFLAVIMIETLAFSLVNIIENQGIQLITVVAIVIFAIFTRWQTRNFVIKQPLERILN